MFTKFDKTNLLTIREILNKKLEELRKETGIKFSINNISYNTYNFSTKLEAVIENKIKENFREHFNQYAILFGLNNEDYGKSFKKGNKTFTIARIDPRKRKMPIICSASDGKEYKFTPEIIKLYLKMEEKNG
jgi:hypothetical protein